MTALRIIVKIWRHTRCDSHLNMNDIENETITVVTLHPSINEKTSTNWFKRLYQSDKLLSSLDRLPLLRSPD